MDGNLCRLQLILLDIEDMQDLARLCTEIFCEFEFLIKITFVEWKILSMTPKIYIISELHLVTSKIKINQ